MSDTLTLHTRRAALAPESLDAEARTVRVTWGTGADVRRLGHIERLDMAGADLSRLVGAPVLDSHRRTGLADQLGVVVDAGIEDGRGWAVIRLRDDRADVWEAIRGGIIRGVSVGYTVERWREERAPDGSRVRVAARWTPHEVSLVPLAADAAATIRSEEHVMETEDTTAPAVEYRDEAAVRGMVRAARLPAELADELVGMCTPAAEARPIVMERWRQRQAAEPDIRTVTMGTSYDDPQTRAAWMGEALHARAHDDHELSEPARQYYGLSTTDLARECLRLRGETTTMLSGAALVERALATGDLPAALTEATRRSVLRGYDRPPGAVLALAGSVTVPDFRAREFVRVSESGVLARKPEGAEIRYTDLAETKTSLQAVTWAMGMVFTREAIINDDLGQLQPAVRLGRMARETEALEAVRQLTANAGAGPVMSDGTELFHGDHGNLAGSGAAISETTLSAARLAMRTQTDGFGHRIGIEPRTLVVPPDLETTAQKQLATITPAVADDANVFGGALRLVVESRLTDPSRWYIVGTGADGMVVVRLAGRAGPTVESETDFDTKSVRFSVLNDFAVDFLDWRSWYSNPGA